jgi:hypothetical protein
MKFIVLKKAIILKLVKAAAKLGVSTLFGGMLYTGNACGMPFILFDNLPYLEPFMGFSHGFYSEDWLVRAVITSSVHFTGINQSQILSSLCHANTMGMWGVPRVDLDNFYLNLGLLQSQHFGNTILNVSTRFSSRVFASLSEYLSHMVSVDNTPLFPDPIAYHQRQLPSAFRESDYTFFYQQFPFYAEIELMSLVSNEILDSELIGCEAESSNEDGLTITFLKKN